MIKKGVLLTVMVGSLMLVGSMAKAMPANSVFAANNYQVILAAEDNGTAQDDQSVPTDDQTGTQDDQSVTSDDGQNQGDQPADQNDQSSDDTSGDDY
ncbi:MAG: hypothetical protein PVI75_00910 [Gammaproteobacteria bacterium]